MYDAYNWKLLIKQLHDQPSIIHVLNRAQLIDDSFTQASDRMINYEIPFKLASYLSKEDDIIPWFTAIRVWKDLINKFYKTEVFPQLQVKLQATKFRISDFEDSLRVSHYDIFHRTM